MALQSGEIVGTYQISSQYGQGGIATVYDAYHPQLKLVVQKQLPLAQMAYNHLSDETSKCLEAYLVHGELLQPQGTLEKAKKEREAVLQIPDTPRWVTDRMTELLNSN